MGPMEKNWIVPIWLAIYIHFDHQPPNDTHYVGENLN